MWRMFTLVAIAMVMLCSATALPAQQEDNCRDILEVGIRNEYQDVGSRDVRTYMQNGICSAYNSTNNQKQGGAEVQRFLARNSKVTTAAKTSTRWGVNTAKTANQPYPIRITRLL